MFKCLFPKKVKVMSERELRLKQIKLEPKYTFEEIIAEKKTPKYAKKTEFSNIMVK